jgi:hypothetical protein
MAKLTKGQGVALTVVILGVGTGIALAVNRAGAAPGQTLYGSISDTVGNPVAALIQVNDLSGERVASGRSKSNGDYAIIVPAGVYDVTILAEGYYPQAHHISVIPGDANCDGVVSEADIDNVQRIVLGIDPWTPSADANQDGVLNMADITKIERIYLGYDQYLTSIRFDIQLLLVL